MREGSERLNNGRLCDISALGDTRASRSAVFSERGDHSWRTVPVYRRVWRAATRKGAVMADGFRDKAALVTGAGSGR